MSTSTRVENCAVSCAATIEARGIPANEVPIVLACLANGLADHAGIPDQVILQMIKTASQTLREAQLQKLLHPTTKL